MLQKKVKIGVIGAGLSGLTAARNLLNKNQNVEIIIFEANDRVGGRTYTINVDGTHYDLGASFIGKTQVDVIELANQAKNQLIPQYQTGKKVMDLRNQISTYSSTIPNNVNIFSLLKMQWVLYKINRMAKKVPVQNPNLCLNAAIWDSMTLNSWISQNTQNQKVKKMVQAAIRVIYGAQLSQLSLLYFLWYVHQSQNFDNLVNIGNGLQQKKLKLGTQQLSIFLSQQIKSKGGQILLDTKVQKVTQSQGKCFVEAKGQKYQFDYLIIAIPPPNVEKIAFQPQLSRDRRHLCKRSFMGSIGKLIIRYKQAYWKNNGFSGQILSDGHDSPITLAYDDTKSNEDGKVQPALIVFVGGAVYRHWIEEQEKMKEVVLKKLALYFDEAFMLEPLSIHYERWQANKSINGGPVACFPPGLLSLVEQIRKPQGVIHWAGTQLARRSCGFMDGAIQSGKRVSQQILTKIDQRKSQKQTLKVYFQQNKPNSTQNLYTKSTRRIRFFEWW